MINVKKSVWTEHRSKASYLLWEYVYCLEYLVKAVPEESTRSYVGDGWARNAVNTIIFSEKTPLLSDEKAKRLGRGSHITAYPAPSGRNLKMLYLFS